MPKGLGDNPLKKENRSRRSGLAASSHPSAPKPGSASYNDVFFHRRPENSAPAENQVEEKQTESVSSLPIATPMEAVPEIVTAVTTEVTSISAEPSAVEQVQSAPIFALLPEPSLAVAVEAEPQHEVQASAEPASQPQAAVATAPQESKPGFFGRIFGRLRK